MEHASGNPIHRLWRSSWRALASTRLALWLLAGLGLLMLTGTLLPQLPAAMDEPARATWFRLAQQKYGSLYAPLRLLGLFELYRSAGFLALAAALSVNTALCTINRLRALSRMIRKGRAAALGTLITHVAVITLLLSLAVSDGYSWQESAVALAAGQTDQLGRSEGLLMRSDGFRIETNAHGQPVDYTAQVTLLAGAQEIRTSSVRPNAPLRASGVGVWLMSYEPGVRAEVRNQEGQPLTLEHAGAEHISGQVSCNLSSGLALLRVPAAGLELHISGVAESMSSEAFYLRVQRDGTAGPLLAETVPAGQQVRVADVRVTLHADPYVIYRLKSDPGAVPALISALALVLGTSLALFSRREHDR
jgi:cytochrome c biogenesis protein ResB